MVKSYWFVKIGSSVLIKVPTNCMKKNPIQLTLQEAKLLYNSNDNELKGIALKVFSEEELTFNCNQIKSLEDACKVLFLDTETIVNSYNQIKSINISAAAYFKLNYIRKAIILYNDEPYKKLAIKDREQMLVYPRFYFSNPDWHTNRSDIDRFPDYNLRLHIYNHDYIVKCYIRNDAIIDVIESDDNGQMGSSNLNVSLLGFPREYLANYFVKTFLEDILTFIYGDLPNFKIFRVQN